MQSYQRVESKSRDKVFDSYAGKMRLMRNERD
jgi:hypothetical protein